MLNLYGRYRNIKRTHQIFTVFAKYGFGWIVDRLAFKFSFKKKRLQKSGIEHRLRLALEGLGPTFVKLGQFLSVRPDLLPQSYIVELSKLQDEVSPLPFSIIKQTIEDELKEPISKHFSSFQERPIASASLAQVHRATIDGHKVAVKVQRPKIRKVIRTDLEILSDLAKIAETRIPELKDYDLTGKADEIRKILTAELNFINEGKNIERSRKNFKDDNTVVIPKIYWDLTTSNILTMQLIDGTKIADIERIKRSGLGCKAVARRGANLILKQVFEHGFFHGDPHPGNIFVTKSGKIAPLDFGMVGQLDSQTLDNLTDLFIGVVERNVDEIIHTSTALGAIDEETNISELKLDIMRLIDEYTNIPLNKINYKAAADEGFVLARKYKMRLPTNLVLLAKSLSTAENIGRILDPSFDIISHARPYVKRLVKKRTSPTSIIKRNVTILREYFRLMKRFPDEFSEISRKIRKGSIEVRSHQFNEFMDIWEKLANRIAVAVVIFVTAYVSIILIDRGPRVLGIPVISGIGFLVAIALAILLVGKILRSKKI